MLCCMYAHVVPGSPSTGRDCFPAHSMFQLVVHVTGCGCVACGCMAVLFCAVDNAARACAGVASHWYRMLLGLEKEPSVFWLQHVPGALCSLSQVTVCCVLDP